MALSVRRLAESFVGEVSGVDLARLDDAATEAIKDAWLRHKVLVFHGQQLDEDGLVAFAERLGDVEVHLRQTRTTGRREVLLVSNIKEDGKPIGRLGNQELNWHMDQIFMAQPTAGTILYAIEVTPEGGDTWFCDLGAAYDALPPALRTKVEGQNAVHSAATADRRVGIQLTEEQKLKAAEVVHPLVRTHPLAGDKGLYFS
ncbi:MAG TPA: TauD/TfdA family dioxygenase, partial [Stellaceae bacterium]|nr:TauD/TfdA family dioxygenase [Stellaceae bacterium]